MDSAPLRLPANQPPDRFYAGGEAIAELRGIRFTGGRTPEDWIASTTTLHGQERLGLSRLPDGRLLVDVVVGDPASWLGSRHLRAFGSDTMLLTKLLHAGQRLPVHLHPDGEFARSRLGRAHGKTEAWIILSPGEVFLGWRRPVTPEQLRELVARQEVGPLLDLMHQFEARPGDAFLVPAGTPHAIGSGILLVEVQEPEDLSILLEWDGFAIDGPTDGHLGLGFDIALQAVDLGVQSFDQLQELTAHRAHGPLLPALADRWFRVDAVSGGDALEPGFGVLVGISGIGELSWPGGRIPVDAGCTLVVPHAAGQLQVHGEVTLLHCRPPAAPGPVQEPSASSR